MAQNTISDELNRLIQAKADIKTALESKGVTIGDSSTLDEFPALIEDMQTGGGGIDTSTLIDLIERDYTGEFVVPNGTTKIGDYAFGNCGNISSVKIPNTVTAIGDSAFKDCSSLTQINIPDSVTTLGNNCFELTKTNGPVIFNSERNYVFSRNLTTVGQSCFVNNTFTTDINFFDTSISAISGQCFQNCNFQNKDLVLPKSITGIWNNSFSGVKKFGNLVLPSSQIITIGNNTHMWDFSGRIFVPGDLLASYKTANNWNSALLVDKLRPLASATYDASTYTVTASGRDTLELYVDASLCDSSVYTFTPGAADASHNIMVKSVDPSFGVLDTYNLEILVEGAAPSYSAAAPTFTVNQPTYTYDYDEGTAMVRVRVNISTGQLEGYQGQYNVSTNCTNYTGDMASMSSTYSNRQDFNYITTFDNPETGPFTFGFTTEAYYKDENQNLLYTAGPATFSDTVTPNWNIPERIAPFTLEIQSNEQPDEYSITVSTDSDGDFVVSITDSNGQTIMDNEVITNSGGPTEIATLPRPEYGEGETYYDIAVYTKGTETYNRSEPELTTVTVYGKEAPEPLAPPTIEITSERADRFMTITNNDENADQIYYSIIRDGDYVETDTLFSSQVQVNIGDQITAYAHDSNGVYPDSEPDSVDVE